MKKQTKKQTNKNESPLEVVSAPGTIDIRENETTQLPATLSAENDTDFVNRLNFYGCSSMLDKPEIKSLTEFFPVREEIQFGTFANGKLVAIGEEKVFDNNLVFEELWKGIKKMSPTAQAKFERYDDYSGQLTVIFPDKGKTIQKDDILNASLTVRNSYTGIVKPSIAFSFDRVWCSNGARRKELVEFKEMNPEIILNFPVLVSMVENEIELEFSKLQTLLKKEVQASELERTLTPAINSLGFPKRITGDAHFVIHKEAEQFGTPLNAFLIYNGFNQILYKSELPVKTKDRIDEKTFDYLYDLNLN